MTTTTPEVGRKYRAQTTTPAAQSVIIEVSKVDVECESGWYVYGYRTNRRQIGRQTMYPREYFIPREVSA